MATNLEQENHELRAKIRHLEDINQSNLELSQARAESRNRLAVALEESEVLRNQIRDLMGKRHSLGVIGENLRTQDNRITDAPIFVVQQEIRDWGYDPDHAEDYKWLDSDNEYQEAESDESDELDRKDSFGEDTGSWVKGYYKERWEFVTACFTEKGCRDFIKLNGHNLHDTRIYAEGSYRNGEWRRVRNFLMEIQNEE